MSTTALSISDRERERDTTLSVVTTMICRQFKFRWRTADQTGELSARRRQYMCTTDSLDRNVS